MNSGQFRATHGHTIGRVRSPEYVAWSAIFARCENENEEKFRLYGARGIKICDRWRKFENFYADMGDKPSALHSLDRYPNNDGDYEPGNCRWATPQQQTRNRRCSQNVIFAGQHMHLIDACRLAGLPYETVRKRITRWGWSANDALTRPVRRRIA